MSRPKHHCGSSSKQRLVEPLCSLSVSKCLLVEALDWGFRVSVLSDAEAVHLFILMEYCSGRSLREAINAGLFVGRLLPTAQRVRLDADGATETQPAPPVAAPSGPSLQRVDERPFLRSHPDGASSTPVRSGDGGEGKAEEALLARASLWELVILKWRISRELVSALAFMHKFGVIHRDLKPSNIFLKASDDGLSIKVDFLVALTKPHTLKHSKQIQTRTGLSAV